MLEPRSYKLMERTLATARLCACVHYRVSLDIVKVDDVIIGKMAAGDYAIIKHTIVR